MLKQRSCKRSRRRRQIFCDKKHVARRRRSFYGPANNASEQDGSLCVHWKTLVGVVVLANLNKTMSTNNGFCTSSTSTLSSSSSLSSILSSLLSAVGLGGLRPPFRSTTTTNFMRFRCVGGSRRSPMENIGRRRVVGGPLLTLFFLLISIILLPIPTTGKKTWTIDELQTLKFPYLTTNDLYMDVCKAGGFLVDIALTRDEVAELEKFNATIKHLNSEIERLDLNAKQGHKSTTDSNFQGNQSKPADYRIQRRNKDQLKKGKKLLKTARKKLRMVARRGHSRQKRAATGRPERIWDYAVIPYEIQSNFSGEHQALFRRAMNHWENHTCLSFVPRRPDDESYIVFTVAECGCCSFVGKRGDGPQAISIGKNCDKFGIVVHELGHVVGFWHEHTRPDREDHVDIFYKNIQQGQDYNFEKLKTTEVNSLGQSYDYASIMHYARDTFARAMYLDTILPKPDVVTQERPEIGQRIRLSPGDVIQTNLLYKCPKCSQSFLDPKGSFYSPVFDNKLEHVGEREPIHCQWRIAGPHGSRVLLNVTSLGIPESPDCSGSHYLEIRDGFYVKSRLIGRYCGSMGPLTIISASNRLWLEYKSPPETLESATEALIDHSHQSDTLRKKGFYASYEILCGGEIVADNGVIESSGYPYDYLPNSDCVWLITVPEDYQVAILFTLFQLEQHEDCIYDYIEFQDGHEENSPTIGRFCGYSTPTNVKSSSNKMRVKFASDASVEKAGFAFRFIKEFDECKTTNHGCQHKCINTLGGYKCECDIGYELHTDGKSCEDACGGYLKGENGTLTSPNFPNLYPHKKRCIWEIEANAQYRITLNFTHFDLEGVHTSCEYDYLKISSIDDDGNLAKIHGTYCGKVTPLFLVTSETNHLRIEFATDSSVAKSGFGAVYFTDKDECDIDNGGCEQICKNVIGSYKCECESGYVLSQDGHHCKEGGCKFELMAPNGQINSPNYPDEYPNKKECVWHFVTTPGHRLQIDFVDFEIEPHQDCAYDRIELYDGSSATAPSLGRYCGPKAPEKILTSKNEMFMVFKSDSSVQRKGFKAVYSTVCGGTLLADRTIGFIYSHAAYGGFSYDNKMYCDWTILASDNMGVGLRFSNFELEDEYNCEYDYVEIYNGEDDEAVKIGRFCGNKIPSTFISSGSALRLHFRSDDTVGVKGFLAEYFLTEPSEQTYVTEISGSSTRQPLEPVINERIKNHY